MHWYGILGKGFLCTEVSCPDTHIKELSNSVNQGDKQE